MKEWMVWALLIVGVLAIVALCYWLTSTLSIWWCTGIVIAANCIMGIYLSYQKKSKGA